MKVTTPEPGFLRLTAENRQESMTLGALVDVIFAAKLPAFIRHGCNKGMNYVVIPESKIADADFKQRRREWRGRTHLNYVGRKSPP